MDVLRWAVVMPLWVYGGLIGHIAGNWAFYKTWVSDQVTSRPEGVELAFTDKLIAHCATIGVEPLEPLPLTPYLVGARQPWQKRRQWMVFLPNGGLQAIQDGALEVRVELMPAHTYLRIEDVGGEGSDVVVLAAPRLPNQAESKQG